MTLMSSLLRLLQRPPAPQLASHTEDLLTSLLVMAWMVEARDPYTGGHLWRVSRFTALLGEAAEIPPDAVARMELGGFLHDLGKIAVPDAILRKAAALTDDEYAIVRTHPEVGARVLAGHPLAAMVRDAILMHHERPDGRGYPHGLSLEHIPLAARIVGIADAFDAMTSARPYRRGMPIETALERLHAGLGSQFDMHLGQTFLGLASHPMLHHIVGHSDDGIPLQECVMCGPTLVMTREQAVGDHIYCASCGGEYRVEDHASVPGAVRPTGNMGAPHTRTPRPDEGLIRRVLREALPRIPAEALLADATHTDAGAR